MSKATEESAAQSFSFTSSSALETLPVEAQSAIHAIRVLQVVRGVALAPCPACALVIPQPQSRKWQSGPFYGTDVP